MTFFLFCFIYNIYGEYMDKIKKVDILNYIVKNIFICFVVVFLGIYISLANGSTDYKAYRKSELTKEAIKRFEDDVKSGKNIDLNDYIDDYDSVSSNRVSKIGIYLSNKITLLSKRVINLIGNAFNLVFGE